MSNLNTKYYKYWGKASKREDIGWDCHLLPYHCLDVAATGRVLMEESPFLKQMAELTNIEKDKMLDWLTFIFAIHDTGKFSNGFQALNPELCKMLHGKNMCANYQEKHWSTGYRFLLNKNCQLFPNSNIDFLKYWYAATIGHHGRPPQTIMSSQPLVFQFPQDVEIDVFSFLNELKYIFSITGVSFGNSEDYYKIFPRISWLVAGITILSDWVGSNRDWFHFRTEEIPLEFYYENIALKQAKAAVRESGILPAKVSSWKGFKELFPEMEPTNLQKAAEQIQMDNTPQLFIVEEETGRGKTEAALALAHRLMSKKLAEGMYFALPTMATANAMHKRIEDVYRKFYEENATPSFILAHSASKMYVSLQKALPDVGDEFGEDNINQDCPLWIADNRKKALLAHVGVGTIDQALLAVLQARHQALRLWGLSSKVLIVDEVHACDDYVHTLLRNLLKFHAAQGGSAILLSATLPANMRKELIESFADGLDLRFNGNPGSEYPLITKCSALGFHETPVKRDNRTRTVEIRSINSYENVLIELKNILKNGQCACWVRNTVHDAITAYHDAQKHFGEENVTLFHARFVLGDRLEIETGIQMLFGPESNSGQRKGKLVIATQVVEQSLDLDFDYMVSDLAPIDLVIQRAGRLCRHNRSSVGDRSRGSDERGEPVMAVYMPVMNDIPDADWYKRMFPKAAHVYQHHGQLWLTADWLNKHGKFTMPDDARGMVEYVYGNEAQACIPDSFEKTENRAYGNDGAAASIAHFNELNLDIGYLPDGVHWIDDNNAPTRLGEMSVLVRLAVRENGKIIPLVSKGKGADWELSQVSLYRRLIAHEDETQRDAIDTAKEEMPDKGKHCLLVLLKKDKDGWIGKALNVQNQCVTVYYDNKAGLQVNKGENDEFDS